MKSLTKRHEIAMQKLFGLDPNHLNLMAKLYLFDRYSTEDAEKRGLFAVNDAELCYLAFNKRTGSYLVGFNVWSYKENKRGYAVVSALLTYDHDWVDLSTYALEEKDEHSFKKEFLDDDGKTLLYYHA